MDDYISREAALNFEMEIEADPDEIQAITKGMALYADYIKSIPAADVVERKSGKWATEILCSDSREAFKVFRCSVCNVADILPTNYCPNCGASMKSMKGE